MITLAVKSFSAAVIFFSTLVTIYTVGPALETRYFPVVSKLVIERMEAIDDHTTKVYAYFNKLRGCTYVGIAWFQGQRDKGFARVPLILQRQEGDTSNPNRPVGAQRSGPWIVSIPIDEVEKNSFVQLTHICLPYWPTTTEFYP